MHIIDISFLDLCEMKFIYLCINTLDVNKIKIIKWPPHSCDLNPIEMMWAIMKRRMRKYK